MNKQWFLLFTCFAMLTLTFYGQQKEGSVTVKDVDGNVYNTVVIGSQVWMNENLKTSKYMDSTPIPNVADDTQWENLTSGAYSWYDNDVTNINPYGAYYNWYAVETGKLCPTGWHIASDEDWTTLMDHLGGYQIAGEKLREAGENGFAALACGYRDGYNGSYFLLNGAAFWWTSTTDHNGEPWMRVIFSDQSSIKKSNVYAKRMGFSVRCIKD